MENLSKLEKKDLFIINGGCKEWSLLFGLAGIAFYVGYHDASGGKHD
ncbi:hypothetical protein [Flagellimonas profundi]|uniref:Class IIb bacteriocin, lactobin A/cerein 7B family n=1 Tax=Flagellimonas profundi TaxID=2915620 RepID=A0ABS3FCL4_9FLAO|nr:hypothetical protein [Allomuricauda profundi]MBO0340896.1 hypothetical protein [Allomuricauda profundi]